MTITRKSRPMPNARTLCVALSIALAGTAAAAPANGPIARAVPTLHQQEFRGFRGAFVPAAAATAPAPSRAAAVRSVTSLADSGAGSLREALVTAVDGDVIDLGGLQGRITLSSALEPAAAVTITGPGSDALVIDAGGRDRVIATSHSLALSKVSLVNGKAPSPAGGGVDAGGCLYIDGDLLLTNATISGCSVGGATSGGAYGGAVAVIGAAYLKYSTIADSHATAYGTAGAGGLAVALGPLVAIHSTISGNSVSQVVPPPARPAHPDGIPAGLAIGGGAATFGSATAYFIFSEVTGNGVSAAGLGDDGTALGGGVFGAGKTVSYFSTIAGNTLSAGDTVHGAGFYMAAYAPPAPGASRPFALPALVGGTATHALVLSTIASNHATSTAGTATGGGVFNAAPLTIQRSALRDNTVESGCTACLTAGGAIIGRSAVTLVASSVTGNSATVTGTGSTYGATGGGIANYYAQPLVIVDSTVSGNTAMATSSHGGGVAASEVEIHNSTIAFNSATGGGGLVLYGDGVSVNMVLSSTIVAGNTASSDPASADVLGNHAPPATVTGSNDIVIAGSQIALPGDTLAQDPLLEPLAYNGGPTLNHALGTGSPAIDTGVNSGGLSMDQRGFGRTIGANPDIGAYERDDDRIFFDRFEYL